MVRVSTLAIAASIVLSGSIAHAKNAHKKAPPPPVEEDEEAADEEAEKPAVAEIDMDDAAAPADDEEVPAEVEAPKPRVHKKSKPVRSKDDWHLSVGPYVWASAVDAQVSANGMDLDASGVQVQGLNHTIKYGGELQGEARFKRFAVTGDLIFGAIGLDTTQMAGPATVDVHGDVSAMMLDSSAGYTVVGDDRSLFAAEVRGGVRYERVSFAVSANISGGDIERKLVFGGSDALAGGRVFVRPSKRFSFMGEADVGVTGASDNTWSALVDAHARVSQHVELQLGYRSLTIDRSNVHVNFHGPRLALQFLF